MTLCPHPQMARRPAVSNLGDAKMVSASGVPTGLDPNTTDIRFLYPVVGRASTPAEIPRAPSTR